MPDAMDARIGGAAVLVTTNPTPPLLTVPLFSSKFAVPLPHCRIPGAKASPVPTRTMPTESEKAAAALMIEFVSRDIGTGRLARLLESGADPNVPHDVRPTLLGFWKM